MEETNIKDTVKGYFNHVHIFFWSEFVSIFLLLFRL
jgi:hypothetical protein